MYLESGYKTITPIQLCNGLAALESEAINFRAFRVYLACFSLLAIRDAASRVRKASRRRRALAPRYRPEEISRLTGTTTKSVSRDLSRLRRASLLEFSEHAIRVRESSLDSSAVLLSAASGRRSWTRPIPVPRSMLRFLARCEKPVLTKTIIAYLLRGLSLDRRSGEVNGKGTVKLSWVARTFGVSERAARYARAELVRLGWIGRDRSSYQRKLNRDGAYFAINLAWRNPAGRTRTQEVDLPASGPDRVLQIAAPVSRTGTVIAPPEERHETPNGSKDQKTRRTEPAGLSTRGGVRNPSLRDVTDEDLRCFTRTEVLYWQAVRQGVIRHSETNALNWLSAAVRARSVPGDPVRVFLGIVRKELWAHITHEQEERARRALVRYREGDPSRFRVPSQVPRARAIDATRAHKRLVLHPKQPTPRSTHGEPPGTFNGPFLSNDARFVRHVTNVFRPQGIQESNAWWHVNREHPEWTRERWDRALAELHGTSRGSFIPVSGVFGERQNV